MRRPRRTLAARARHVPAAAGQLVCARVQHSRPATPLPLTGMVGDHLHSNLIAAGGNEVGLDGIAAARSSEMAGDMGWAQWVAGQDDRAGGRSGAGGRRQAGQSQAGKARQQSICAPEVAPVDCGRFRLQLQALPALLGGTLVGRGGPARGKRRRRRRRRRCQQQSRVGRSDRGTDDTGGNQPGAGRAGRVGPGAECAAPPRVCEPGGFAGMVTR